MGIEGIAEGVSSSIRFRIRGVACSNAGHRESVSCAAESVPAVVDQAHAGLIVGDIHPLLTGILFAISIPLDSAKGNIVPHLRSSRELGSEGDPELWSIRIRP